LAMFVICITERSKILDPNNPAVDIFPIMFEVVSAYGTNGLSLGVSDDDFSLSGGFTPLSKVVICLVMLRGRHRGLPVAIDRAVVLPWEYEKQRHEDHPAEQSEERTDQGYGVQQDQERQEQDRDSDPNETEPSSTTLRSEEQTNSQQTTSTAQTRPD